MRPFERLLGRSLRGIFDEDVAFKNSVPVGARRQQQEMAYRKPASAAWGGSVDSALPVGNDALVMRGYEVPHERWSRIDRL